MGHLGKGPGQEEAGQKCREVIRYKTLTGLHSLEFLGLPLQKWQWLAPYL